MLPSSQTEKQESASTRYSNFIALRFLEPIIPTQLFDQVLTHAQNQIQFPQRIDWKGKPKDLTFEELKTNFSHIDQNFLPQLVNQQNNGYNQQNKKTPALLSKDTNSLLRSKIVAGSQKNLAIALRQRNLGRLNNHQKLNIHQFDASRFERMKTVFGHALLDSYEMTSIYSVLFDKEGKFIISGADDGIIKIWDRDTLNLQNSLHGHMDVITDVDISKCNKYLASSSKDGAVFVWDFKRCTLIEKLPTHTSSVNNIKFFEFKIQSEHQSSQSKGKERIQLLVTCSDDGTAKVYDFSENLNSEEIDEQEFLNQNRNSGSQEEQTVRRAERHEQNHQKKQNDRFFLTLTSDDYRPGARNKKLNSITLNSNGILVGGSKGGEVLMWKLDFQAILRHNLNKASQFLGSFKKHSKDIHFQEFSPNGKFLLTGSIDGTAKVWNLEQEKMKKGDSNSQPKPLGLTDDRLKVSIEEKRRNAQCDCLTWSCQGRYAIVSISCREEGNNIKDVSVIKVWDSYTDTIIQDLGKENGIQLYTYSFVVAAHPKYEEILLTGSEGGQLILWNLHTRKMIKRFIEYGIYTQEKYTFNDPYDGKFSPDGSCFVVGSQNGTISLFSNEGVPHKYAATRVEQFFIQDGSMHNENIYEKYEQEPQICNSNLIPYEYQPPSKLIGKFKNKKNVTHFEYERQLIMRKEMCKEEENYIKNMLEEGMQDDFYNNQQEGQERMLIDNESDGDLNVNRRVINGGRLAIEENRERPQNRRGRRRRNVNQQNNIEMQLMEQVIQRINQNPNYDPENSFYDRESDQDFDYQEAEMEEYGEEFNEDQNEDDSDYRTSWGAKKENNTHEQVQQQQQQQQEQIQRNNRNSMDARDIYQIFEQKREEEKKSRQERARRREMIREEAGSDQEKNSDEEEEDDEEGGNQEEEDERIKTRGQRKRIINDHSQNEEMSDKEARGRSVTQNSRRRLIRNNEMHNDNRSKLQREYEFLSSEEQSFPSEEEEESYYASKNHHKGKHQKEKKKHVSANTRNHGRRGKISYANMDESSDEFMEQEEEKGQGNQTKEQSKNQYGKKGKSKHSSQEEQKEEIVQINTSTTVNKKQFYDEDYEFKEINDQRVLQEEGVMEQQRNEQQKCSFCQRVDQPLIGPFVKYNIKHEIVDGPLYFHKDCIEINIYSKYDNQRKKWINIGKALEMLIKKKKYKCVRCNTNGATIKCSTCNKFFHGYLCSYIYTVLIDDDNYQCFECRNLNNYKVFEEKQYLPDDQYQDVCKKIQREYLLQTEYSQKNYIPQINDEVYYFFQGHEKFLSCYNCFFYCGDSQQLVQYPWKKYPELINTTLCRITNISYTFPSKNAAYLIKKYGKQSHDIQQTPQILVNMELEIASNKNKTFSLVVFPNELPDFLILKPIYEINKNKFQDLIQKQQLVGSVFSTKCKNFLNVKIINVQAKEGSIYPNSEWETILFQHQENYGFRNRYGRRGQRNHEQEVNEQPPGIMNFWELNLVSIEENEFKGYLEVFNQQEREKILSTIQEFNNRKGERIIPFLERVSEEVAPDYKCHVPAESFLSMIIQRVENNYYRSQEQLFSDLDLICYNARIYNGDEEYYAKEAKALTDKLKQELKKKISSFQEQKLLEKEETKNIGTDLMKIPGKLTVPVYRGSSMTSFDLFLKEKDENNMQQLNNNIGRNRTQIEDVKMQNEKIKPSVHTQLMKLSANERSSSGREEKDFNIQISLKPQKDENIMEEEQEEDDNNQDEDNEEQNYDEDEEEEQEEEEEEKDFKGYYGDTVGQIKRLSKVANKNKQNEALNRNKSRDQMNGDSNENNVVRETEEEQQQKQNHSLNNHHNLIHQLEERGGGISLIGKRQTRSCKQKLLEQQERIHQMQLGELQAQQENNYQKTRQSKRFKQQ